MVAVGSFRHNLSTAHARIARFTCCVHRVYGIHHADLPGSRVGHSRQVALGYDPTTTAAVFLRMFSRGFLLLNILNPKRKKKKMCLSRPGTSLNTSAPTKPTAAPPLTSITSTIVLAHSSTVVRHGQAHRALFQRALSTEKTPNGQKPRIAEDDNNYALRSNQIIPASPLPL